MFNNVTLNDLTRTVSRDGHDVYLTPVEHLLFVPLWLAKGEPIDRNCLNKGAYPACTEGSYSTWK